MAMRGGKTRPANLDSGTPQLLRSAMIIAGRGKRAVGRQRRCSVEMHVVACRCHRSSESGVNKKPNFTLPSSFIFTSLHIACLFVLTSDART